MNNNLAEWVLTQTVLLRQANQKALEASQEWNIKNEEWKAHQKAHGRTDIVDLARRKGENLPLKDAMAKYTFWAGEAQRIASFINAELQLRELMRIAHATQ